MENRIENDFVYMDIFAIKPNIREKLHLTDEELNFTEEDMELINTSKYVDLDKLKELGISKAMFTMAFSETSKNHRGLRMRTVVAILNAIRNRNIQDPFNEILVKGGNTK